MGRCARARAAIGLRAWVVIGFAAAVGAGTPLAADGAGTLGVSAATPGRNGLLVATEIVRHGHGITSSLLFLSPGGNVRRRVRMSDGMTAFAASPGARQIAYREPGGTGLADGQGRHRHLVIADADFPAWSPDGRRLAALIGRREVVVVDAHGRNRRVVARGQGLAGPLVWSPNGRRIAVRHFIPQPKSSPCAENADVLQVDAAGGHLRRLYTPLQCGTVFSLDWAPNGRHLVVHVDQYLRREAPVAHAPVGIVVTDAHGGHARQIATSLAGQWPVWSPDGRLIAVTANCPKPRFGTYCVNTMRPDGSNVRPATSPIGGAGGAVWPIAWQAR